MTAEDNHDPAGHDPLVAAFWDARDAMTAADDAIRRHLRREFPPGRVLKSGVHEHFGERVSLEGAEVDAVTHITDDDYPGPHCYSSPEVPAVRLILARSAVAVGGSRVLTLSYPGLIRAGAK